jgi:hypothetical protein
MTEQQILDLGPALADYLEPFQFCCDYTQTFRAVAKGLHLDWLTFDEAYGAAGGFLTGLGQQP